MNIEVIKANHIIKWFIEAAKSMNANKEYLTQLDSDIGDADHGFNMVRGFNKVYNRTNEFLLQENLGILTKDIAMTLLSSIGGAAGPLYGSFFLEFSKKLDKKTTLNLSEFSEVFELGTIAVEHRGNATFGDKTLIDVLVPASEALKKAVKNKKTLVEGINLMAKEAELGMNATIPLIAKKGRASYLGVRSVGYKDPGAASCYFLLLALKETMTQL